jgi:hypothetical protein
MKLAAIRAINEVIVLSGLIKSLPLRAISKFVRSAVPRDQHHRLPHRIRDPWSIARYGARRYVRSDLSIEQLFMALKQRNISYAVLRWFEDLPYIEEGEDIDFLVADHDLPLIKDLFSYRNKGGQACDIYSVSGLQGSNFDDMPYYPPHLAREILATRVWSKEIYAVPDQRRHFLSLAYHAVFHKGKKSGLPNDRHAIPKGDYDHDYQRILQELASQLPEVSVDFEFSKIFQFLKSQNWVPELDTLRRLAVKDEWLWDLLPESSKRPGNEKGETLLFVVREWAIVNDKLEFIKKTIEGAGLEIVQSFMLSEHEKKIATQSIRGGKWDRGPFPVSGGLPACLMVCFDPEPIPPAEEDTRDHPFVRNRNVFLKHTIRDQINKEMLSFFHVNCIHSSDDEFEVWEHLRQVLPGELAALREQVALLRARSG